MNMDTIDKITEALSKRSLDYSMINYPDKRVKSIDLIAINKNNSRIILKILKNKKITKIKQDLQNVARIGIGIPIMIDDNVEQEVINDKGNVFEMNVNTFERILDGEKVFLYKTRGGIFVRINSKELRRRREEMGLSLGEVAQSLGVSRISIYEYEREDSYVSIDIAEKLVEIFGEDILGGIFDNFGTYDISSESENLSASSISSKLITKLTEKGFKTVSMSFTAVDIIALKGGKKLLFSLEAQSTSESLIKFNEAKKISEKMSSNLIVVVKDSKNKKAYEKEGFNTIAENEIMKYEFD